MKILPTMCKGVVFVHEDGKTFEMAPVQVFMGINGMTLIRIGRNVLFFDRDGKFDGTESKTLAANDPELMKKITEAFEVQGDNKGIVPDEPYFHPGHPNYEHETRSWPTPSEKN